MEDVLYKIKEKWFLTEPLYFATAMTHEIIIDDTLECPIATGEGKIHINPSAYADKSERFLEESIKVELLRILLKHPYQRILDDSERHLKASNLVISENMKFTEFHLESPTDVFNSTVHNGSSMEEFYKLLPESDKQDSNKSNSNGKQGYSDDGCNDDADARTQYWQDSEEQRFEINQVIDKFVNESSQACGTIPGALLAEIKASMTPEFNYKGVLQQFRRSIIDSSRSLTRMRPNRRFGYDYMGSKRNFTTKVLVALDCSGSVSDDDVSRAVSLINGMLRYGVQQVDSISFDTKVYEETLQRFTKKASSFKIKGRGGTDFNDIFRYTSENGDYDGVIIITDGYAPVPDKKWISKNKGRKFVWCLNNSDNFHTFASKKEFEQFGKTTYIK